MDITEAPRVAPKTTSEPDGNTAPIPLGRILVALDASDHANRALDEAIRLAGNANGVVTGIHAYAARMHDVRFRQMEGGLPERYLEEEEMDYQREVHDDLITHGLQIISDSYHDVAGQTCETARIPYRRLSPEGKNYRRVVEAVESGDFDLLALGALGIGAVPGSVIGTVCERVVRRSPIDVLVIRDSGKAIGDGPIVVAIDGSSRSYGALKTALDIGRRLGVEVRAVAAYDPYYHYVAFNKIAGVLSEEAGKVFRFKEQEQLHEELIDDGIAKIYQSHLDVSRTIAADEGVDITCELVDGKIYRAIAEYAEKVGASLLMMGKVGVHADASLDIGGNAENLLRMAPCHVWLGQATYTPPFEILAEETISWSREAEELLNRAPEFVRGMARKAVLRAAQEKGHTYITSDIVREVSDLMMPGRRPAKSDDKPLIWSDAATAMVEALGDETAASGLRLRAEKRARREGAETVSAEHVRAFLERVGAAPPKGVAGAEARLTSAAGAEARLTWAAAAEARLARVPASMRDRTRARIEAVARERDATEVTLETVEAGLVEARKAMEEAMKGDKPMSGPPAEPNHAEPDPAEPDPADTGHADDDAANDGPVFWTPEAEARLENIPAGFMRTMTRKRVEAFARRNDLATITLELVEEKYAEWAAGSAKQAPSMEWTASARGRIERIPDAIRGMVMLEVERRARKMESLTVTDEVIDQARGSWEGSGMFHSDADSDHNK